MANTAAVNVEYSRTTCPASMQRVSEQQENKVSWLDQLGSWWDKNGTTIITGAITVGVGALALATVIATAGTALPLLAASSVTLSAAVGATVATAGTMAMATGTASILSTLPGLDKVYGPTVNTAGFQELQMVSVVVASMGTQYLGMLDSVAQSTNAQTPKTQEQTSTKTEEQTAGTGNVENGNPGSSWYSEDGSMNYPPNNGAIPGTESNTTLQVGRNLGRYGGIGPQSDFVCEPGASPDSLSLPPTTDPSIYNELQVVKPIPGVIQSTVAPWGGSTGLGLQYQLPMPIQWYLDNKYLVLKG